MGRKKGTKKDKKPEIVFGDGWSFALVNGKLAEVYFDKKYGIWSHCYIKKDEYKMKREQEWIKADTGKYQFTYRKGYYFDKILSLKQKAPSMSKIFPKSDKKKMYSLEELENKLRSRLKK